MISLANVSTNSIAIDDEWNFGNDDEYLMHAFCICFKGMGENI